MKRAAIVSEYDPFHNGHKYQTDKLREMGAECIVSVLGGTFSQRGNCHITDKYYRAEAAVRSGGCDLVLELPYPYSCSGAEYFAAAGVSIAAKFCDSIAFGCETDTPELLCEIAEYTCTDEYKHMLREKQIDTPDVSAARIKEEIIKNELSAEHAREAVLPNNILCIEYLRAIYSLGLDLEPVFIKRYGADHDSYTPCGDICSASLIREKIRTSLCWDQFCPTETVGVLKAAESVGKLGASLSHAEKAVLFCLRNVPCEAADNYAECGGGLGRRIVRCASTASSLEGLYKSLATKRYTNARIRRAVISLLTGADESDEKALPQFTCLLSANRLGLSVIKGSDFPVVSTISDLRKLDLPRAVELYLNAERFASLCFAKAFPEFECFTRKPSIIS